MTGPLTPPPRPLAGELPSSAAGVLPDRRGFLRRSVVMGSALGSVAGVVAGASPAAPVEAPAAAGGTSMDPALPMPWRSQPGRPFTDYGLPSPHAIRRDSAGLLTSPARCHSPALLRRRPGLSNGAMQP